MKAICLNLIFFMLSFPLFAQKWEPTYGPNMNAVHSIIQHKGLWYAATEWGVFSSFDGGKSWNKLPVPTYIYDIKVFKNKLLASSYYGGLFISTNGKDWEKVQEIKVGIRWIEVVNEDVFVSATHMPCDIFHSSDGINWKVIPIVDTLREIAGMCSIGNTLFVHAQKKNEFGTCLLSTSDRGETWEVKNAGGSSNRIRSNGNSIFLSYFYGISVSHDNGNSWGNLTATIPKDAHIYDFTVDDEYLFAATTAGVFRTKKNEDNWQNVGLSKYPFFRAFVLNEEIYVCSMRGDFFKSDRHQNSWEKLRKYGMYAGAGVHSLRSNGNKLVAMANYNSPVYYSEDFGFTWDSKDTFSLM
jgi:photosystem II stability/assembly factor-like uncharacterized protein